MNHEIITLYNEGQTNRQIAIALGLPLWKVAAVLEEIRPTAALKPKRTTPEMARALLVEAGATEADFEALATHDADVWQPAAAKLLDAGARVADVAKWTAVSRARVYKWASKRAA